MVWPQYMPPETRPTLHIPLGLSEGLKSSSAGPQLWRKAAAIALPKQAQWSKVHHVEIGMFSTEESMSGIVSSQNPSKNSRHTQFATTIIAP